MNIDNILIELLQNTSFSDDYFIYKLANYNGKGIVIDLFNSLSLDEFEEFISKELQIFLYNNGNGKFINSNYLHCEFRNRSSLQYSIDFANSIIDNSQREACWRFDYRGALGETLLHILIMCHSKIQNQIARILLKCFPKLALDCMESDDFFGTSALHLAIIYDFKQLLIDLLECGARIDQRSIGKFFLPFDTNGSYNYDSLTYFGEYPLSWAAAYGNEFIYNVLIEHGADPNLRDSFGNTLLHIVVIWDKLSMFRYALKNIKRPAKNDLLNNDGLTPLTLACKLGRAAVFEQMLELSAKEFWRYSNITCSGYSLNALDTLQSNGEINWNSALLIILNGHKEEHLDMIYGEIIKRILEEKWKSFAQKVFTKRLLIYCIHLICLMFSLLLKPISQRYFEWNFAFILSIFFDVTVILSVANYFLIEQMNEISIQGFRTYLKQLSNTPTKMIYQFSHFLIILSTIFRILGMDRFMISMLIFAAPTSWFYFMFFAGAVRLTGPFVTMILNMISGDLFTFTIIYVVILLGFSQAFFVLYHSSPNAENKIFSNYLSTWMGLFHITLGEYNYSDMNNLSSPTIAKIVFVLFLIFVPILLLNMLIAMMGNTYARVVEKSEKEWIKQWAKIIVSLEHTITKAEAAKYLKEYSIQLSEATDTNLEERGIVVIKKTNKTRASQRRGALTNWKMLINAVKKRLKRLGINADILRKMIWESFEDNLNDNLGLHSEVLNRLGLNEYFSSANTKIRPENKDIVKQRYFSLLQLEFK